MLAIEKQIGIKPKELEDLVELPECFVHCWMDFVNLSSTRPVGMGASPITYSEILAYSTLNNIDYDPWEIQVIKLFDRTALDMYNAENAKEMKKKK